MLDSLVRVSRRVRWAPFVSILRLTFPQSAPGPGSAGCNGGADAPHLPAVGVPRRELMLTPARLALASRLTTARSGMDAHFLPFQQFQALFTPLSRSFSSFPHGTCLLSVSHPYLALDGIYHPLRAAIPSNSTRRGRPVRRDTQGKNRIITVHDAVFQQT